MLRKPIAMLYLTAVLGMGFAEAQPAPNRPPPNAPKSRAVKDLESALQQTAAVVDGLVIDVRYEFTPEDGPWTVVTLSDVKAHIGSAPGVMQIRQFGGRLPDKRMVVVTELPVFVKGKRHVMFLRNTAWSLSPVVGDYAFRVEKVNDAETLVNSDGFAVTDLAPAGVELGPALFGPPQVDGSPPKAM